MTIRVKIGDLARNNSSLGFFMKKFITSHETIRKKADAHKEIRCLNSKLKIGAAIKRRTPITRKIRVVVFLSQSKLPFLSNSRKYSNPKPAKTEPAKIP